MNFSLLVQNRLSLSGFLPELVLIGGALFLLLLGTSKGKKSRRRASLWVGFLSLVVFLGLVTRVGLSENQILFSGAFTLDTFSTFFRVFFGLTSLVTLFFISVSKEFDRISMPEVVSFILALTMSLSVMAAASDILMLYLSLEMVSVLSYVMVGYKRHSRLSSEAGLKYILYGAFSSGVMIFGLSFLYGFSGKTSFQDLGTYFSSLESISTAPMILFSLLCVMVGFGYKIAAFPTQMWCPDVYQGAPLPVTAFLSVGPKAAGFALLLRFFLTSFGIHEGKGPQMIEFIHWGTVFSWISALTMTVGNLAALAQKNLKRLMAYSSIAHAGYLLLGVATLTSAGAEAVLFYLVGYFLMNFGAFVAILMVSNQFGSEDLEACRGLGWRSPILGVVLTIFLFSLTGLPPFVGFVGKYFLFTAIIQKGMYGLAIAAAINTVISLFYYVRVIKTMWLDTPRTPGSVQFARPLIVFSTVLATLTVVIGLYWSPIVRLTALSVSSLFN